IVLGKARVMDLVNASRERAGRGRQVIQIVSLCYVIGVRRREGSLEPSEGVTIVEVAANVLHPPREPLPRVRMQFARNEALDVLGRFLAKLIAGQVVACERDQRELLRKQVVPGEI